MAAFLFRVHPHPCEKFQELFYFQFFLSFVLLSIMVYMFSSIFDAFWASFGLELWGFSFLFFFKSKTSRVGVGAGSASQKAVLAALEGK